MSRYQQLIHRAVGTAFILGPMLFVLAAGEKLRVGLERESFMEGVLIGYGSILFVVIYLKLAGRLGEEMPHLGFVCALSGLAGMTAAVMPASARIWQLVFLRHGVNESIWALIHATPEFLPLGMLAPLGPLTSILLGIGFWQTRALPRWIAALLILAGIAFVLAQAFRIGLLYLYPFATVAWLLALAPTGWRHLTKMPLQ